MPIVINFWNLALDIALNLSKLTGGTWYAEKSPHHDDAADLVDAKSGLRLYIHVVWDDKGKVSITPDVNDFRPDYTWYDDPKLGIKATAARGGEVLAKDIHRRLHADALAYYQALVKRKADREAYDNHRHTLARRMAVAAGVVADKVEENRKGRVGFLIEMPNWHSYWYPPRAEVSVSLNKDNEARNHELVDIKVENLTPEEAESILALLKGIIKE